MSRKARQKNAIKEMMVVDDPAAVKLLFRGRYSDILDIIDNRELSVSDIARILKINPGSVQYHLKELEKHRLVMLVHEEQRGNMVKKLYRATARMFYIDGSKYKVLYPDDMDSVDRLYDGLLKSLSCFGYDIPPEKLGEAKMLLEKYDRRKKELIRQIQDIGLEHVEGAAASDVYHIALLLREIEDPEMTGLSNDLRVFLSGIRRD